MFRRIINQTPEATFVISGKSLKFTNEAADRTGLFKEEESMHDRSIVYMFNPDKNQTSSHTTNTKDSQEIKGLSIQDILNLWESGEA